MTTAMRIGGVLDTAGASFADLVDQVRKLADAGYAHAFVTQTFDYDALTLLAAVATQVPTIELGTAVVPVYRSHPMALAQQALSVQATSGNRLILGIGLSHQIVIEGMWGLSFDKPAGYMREYLASLMPLVHGETVNITGERLTTNAFQPIDVPGVTAPPVLVAALGTTMLKLAGRVADGTVTWMTGLRTIGTHISPTIRAAAEEAGRPAPRVGVSLPVSITADVAGTKEKVNQAFSIYPNLPSYRAMLDKEGADGAADIAFLGDEESIARSLDSLADAGATDFVASVVGTSEERKRTFAFLSERARATS